MRTFWDRVSSGVSLVAPPFFSALHQGFAHASAALGPSSACLASLFHECRRQRMPDGASGALSVYDVDPLRRPWDG